VFLLLVSLLIRELNKSVLHIVIFSVGQVVLYAQSCTANQKKTLLKPKRILSEQEV